MNENISLKGKVNKWEGMTSLNTICPLIPSSITCRVVVVKEDTNFAANPKSVLNMLSLDIKTGDEIEIILLGEHSELIKDTKTIKQIFSPWVVFSN